MVRIKKRYWILLSLVAIVCLYHVVFYYEGDPFLKDVKTTARQGYWRFADELDKHIPPGTTSVYVFKYLEERGFSIFETEVRLVSESIGERMAAGDDVYIAWREWWPSPLVKVKVNIVLIVRNGIVVETYGINSLTGL